MIRLSRLCRHCDRSSGHPRLTPSRIYFFWYKTHRCFVPAALQPHGRRRPCEKESHFYRRARQQCSTLGGGAPINARPPTPMFARRLGARHRGDDAPAPQVAADPVRRSAGAPGAEQWPMQPGPLYGILRLRGHGNATAGIYSVAHTAPAQPDAAAANR